MDVKTILSDWQKAVNTIAHALNKAGYDGDSPESKALELLAGRCEGTADAKEIAQAAVDANTLYQREYLPSHYAQYGEFGDSDHLVLRVDYIAETIAPLLKPSVDVRGLLVDLRKVDLTDEYAEKYIEEIVLRHLTDSREELERLRTDKNAAYTERNRLVAFIASLFPSQQCKTDIDGWNPEWHGCVYIETPAGQLSWHFHDSDAELFDHVPYGSPIWDGHSTPEKYVRLRSLIDIRALSETWGEQEANRD